MKELSVHETQKVALEILKNISDVCEELDIRYYLLWGTLIGAVRHKGLIPWDDDIDIGIPRKDVQRIIDYYNSAKNINNYYKAYTTSTKENYFFPVKRIVDTRTIVKGEKRPTKKQCDCGIFVDVYPIEEAGETFEEASKFLRQQGKLVMMRDFSIKDKFVHAKTSLLYTVAKIPLYLFAKVMGFKFWDNMLERRSNKRSASDTQYKCVWTGCSCNPDKGVYHRDVFEKTEKARFEQYYFSIPAGYDEILTRSYGDYMKLPPENERIGHHEYKAYWKGEKQ